MKKQKAKRITDMDSFDYELQRLIKQGFKENITPH